MKTDYVKNPVWANAEQTLIDCEINHPTYGWIPFTASPDDVEAHGRDIFAALAKGVVAQYVPPPPPTTEELAAAVRAERNTLLAATDWVLAKAYETQTRVPQEWAEYRQSLRDLPLQPNFPHDVSWPRKPQ
jgi:hypothetical protein